MSYKVYLTTKLKVSDLASGSGIIAVEPEDYTLAEIRQIKTKGYTLLAYLSAGTLEKNRPWYKQFKDYKLARLADWPDEWYMDMRDERWTDYMLAIAKLYKRMGFDGWWVDNIDVYSEYKSKKMFDAIWKFLKSLNAMSKYVMINGGSEWVDDALDMKLNLTMCINGYTQEEVFSRIIDYDGKGKFARQKKDAKAYYQTVMKRAKKNGVACFCLEYTRESALKTNIKTWCKEHSIGYYIASKVNL